MRVHTHTCTHTRGEGERDFTGYAWLSIRNTHKMANTKYLVYPETGRRHFSVPAGILNFSCGMYMTKGA